MEVPLTGLSVFREEVWPGLEQVGLGAAAFLSLQHCALPSLTARSNVTKQRLPNKESEQEDNWGQVVVGLGLSLLLGERGARFCHPAGDLFELFKMEQPAGCWHRQVWPAEWRAQPRSLPPRLGRKDPGSGHLCCMQQAWLGDSHIPPSFFFPSMLSAWSSR